MREASVLFTNGINFDCSVHIQGRHSAVQSVCRSAAAACHHKGERMQRAPGRNAQTINAVVYSCVVSAAR